MERTEASVVAITNHKVCFPRKVVISVCGIIRVIVETSKSCVQVCTAADVPVLPSSRP
jgi:hypothetical protein